jgi:hypothetical protein
LKIIAKAGIYHNTNLAGEILTTIPSSAKGQPARIQQPDSAIRL